MNGFPTTNGFACSSAIYRTFGNYLIKFLILIWSGDIESDGGNYKHIAPLEQRQMLDLLTALKPHLPSLDKFSVEFRRNSINPSLDCSWHTKILFRSKNSHEKENLTKVR